MTDQWRPVENGEYESQHVTDSCIIEGEWLTVQERVVGSDDTEVATIALPDHLRLCERVEDVQPRRVEKLPVPAGRPPSAASLQTDVPNYSQVPVGEGKPPTPASVEDAPITEAALQEAEWICIPEDEGIYEHWLSSDEDDTYIMVIIRGEEQGVFVHYGEMSHEYIDMPGCRTMAQLAALVEMLGDAE